MKNLVTIFIFALIFGAIGSVSLFRSEKVHAYYLRNYNKIDESRNPFKRRINSTDAIVFLKVIGTISVLVSIFLCYEFFKQLIK